MTTFDYVQFTNDGEYEAERAFVESFFAEGGELESFGLRLLPPDESKINSSLFLDFFSSWEDEKETILVSQTCLVPQEDPLAGRTNTSLAACFAGEETLIAAEHIAPPFIALRVDGRAAGDEDYPLIRTTGIRIRANEQTKNKKRLKKKISLLEEFLKAADKPLASLPKPVWIAVGGDMMLDRGATDILFKEGPPGIFGETAQMLAEADIALVNLEGVISSRGEKTPKSFNFRFVPETAPALRNAGINAVLHANNHVYDYGKDAFLDSLTHLNQAEIGILGAGLNDDDASKPFVFTQGEQTFRIFGLASFPRERNGWDGVSAAAGTDTPGMLHAGRGGAEKIKGKITPNDTAAVNIILFHGGVEWSRRPDSATRELYTGLIAAGADLIIGSHPHVVQGFEWVNDKPVFWSLGNYVFGGMENTDGGEEGLFIRLGYLNGQLLYIEPFSLILTHTRTDIAPPENLDNFYKLSRELRKEK